MLLLPEETPAFQAPAPVKQKLDCDRVQLMFPFQDSRC
jgi:hypothetical protein